MDDYEEKKSKKKRTKKKVSKFSFGKWWDRIIDVILSLFVP